MKGEAVTVWRREEEGTDALNEPIYKWNPTVVENVLVRPINDLTSDVSDVEHPDGIKVRYCLAFPKTYDGKPLAHCKISLSGRGMTEDDALPVIGSPDYLKPCPTAWNMLVYVGRIDG